MVVLVVCHFFLSVSTNQLHILKIYADDYHDDFPDTDDIDDDEDDDDMPPSTTNNRRLAPLPFSPRKKTFKMEVMD